MRDLFLEGLIFGGAYLRFKIDWASLIVGRKFPVLLCFTFYLRAISKYKPPRGLIFGGAIYRRVFCVTSLGGLIFGGAYTWRGLFSEFYGITYLLSVVNL